jgi:hypothetical protein
MVCTAMGGVGGRTRRNTPLAPAIVFLSLFFAAPLFAQETTPAPYSNEATRLLVGEAMARHRTQDSLVNDYRATIRYRMSFAVGRRRWGRAMTLAAEEQQGTVHWQRPNDLRLDILGRRSKSRREDIKLSTNFDRPWFVPRGLGDSVRFFGNDFPERAALHPLAKDGPDWYRYELEDSISFANPNLGVVKLYRLSITPRRNGPSLIAGAMYLDALTKDVVRLTFRYVGTALWVDAGDKDFGSDSNKVRRANAFINRILSVNADLEYSLQDGKYWMPYRQLLAGQAHIPLISDVVVPFELITSFSEYAINTGEPVAFEVELPDSGGVSEEPEAEVYGNTTTYSARRYADRWQGGRYEVHRAPKDSLEDYDGWSDSLDLDLSPEDDARIRTLSSDLAHLSEQLSSELTGRRLHGINYERFADIVRYNRVQGLSFGLGYQLHAPLAFTVFQGTARLGLSDGRLTGRLSILRDAPAGTITLSGYREVREVEPFTRNFAIGNSINALFVAHDNADYYLGEGASLIVERSLDRGIDLTLVGRFERQSTVESEAESELNDLIGGSGRFPLNPAILEGNFFGGAARIDGQRGFTGWSITGDALAGQGEGVARVSGEVRQRIGNKRGLTISFKTGIASSEALPQALFRAGGLQTVRGYDYGSARGQAFWSVQTDFTLSQSWGFRPVVFLDAGNASSPGEVFTREPLVGAGIGASFLRGLIRFDLSQPLTQGTKLRFDIVFSAAR